MMHVIYNSENYCVVEYPDEHAYEFLDKRSARGAFFQGDIAARFKESMWTAAAEEATVEHLDEFLDDFEVAPNFPVAVH